MGSDVLLLYGRAGSRGGGGVPRDEALDGVAGERAARLGGEQRPGGIGAELGEPGPHDLDGLGGEGGGPILANGVDTSVIALWLGHEGTETTQIYLHADMTIKEQALARVQQPGTSPGRYRPPDSLLAFLDNL